MSIIKLNAIHKSRRIMAIGTRSEQQQKNWKKWIYFDLMALLLSALLVLISYLNATLYRQHQVTASLVFLLKRSLLETLLCHLMLRTRWNTDKANRCAMLFNGTQTASIPIHCLLLYAT